MKRTSIALSILLVALGCLLGMTHATTGGGLLGEWKLVQQNYGEGKMNLIAESDDAVRLEFYRQAATIQARIRTGSSEPLSWPRLVQGTERAIHEQERWISVDEDRVRVRYRVDPSRGDDLVLEVTEEYRVIEDGRALVGTVDVRFLRHGEDRGSYRLHRRFERQR